jgi:hypothetical protein
MQGNSNPLSDLLLLPRQIRQEVTRMVKSILRFGFFIIIILILFMMMFSAGWIKIVLDSREISDDIKNVENEFVPRQLSETKIQKNFIENPLFRFESHIVNPGENLFDLERSYGTNWKVIQRINKIEDPYRLTVGTIIWVPVRIVKS